MKVSVEKDKNMKLTKIDDQEKYYVFGKQSSYVYVSYEVKEDSVIINDGNREMKIEITKDEIIFEET